MSLAPQQPRSKREGSRRGDYGSRDGERPSRLGECCSGGENVVNKQHSTAIETACRGERPHSVCGSFVHVESFLRPGFSSVLERGDPQIPGLLEQHPDGVKTASRECAATSRHRDDQVGRRQQGRDGRGEGTTQRAGDIGATVFLEREDGAPRLVLVSQRAQHFEAADSVLGHARCQTISTRPTEGSIRGPTSRALNRQKQSPRIQKRVDDHPTSVGVIPTGCPHRRQISGERYCLVPKKEATVPVSTQLLPCRRHTDPAESSTRKPSRPFPPAIDTPVGTSPMSLLLPPISINVTN